MNRMMTWLKVKAKDKKGQTMVEYALLVVLIGLVVALAIPNVTNGIATAYGHIADKLEATPVAPTPTTGG
ncbi:Flp family type IVb pilin [Geotalea sp. SG265]|uniref:Flp family type IVb pilin n=1 Tax=Geotalea sp. SG265 TaxID=2922867 RepID=UPI001FAF93AC|nr:Flp family type IVb pilin [Geotalea sp. SG265]